MKKQTRAREFNSKARKEIYARDMGCIFCRAGYRMDGAVWMDLHTFSVMHYIPRSRGGLGIPQNGALGCQWHHTMMDNGREGRRQEMLQFFREYLRSCYADWDEERLTYNKWDF
ncbi:MAG: hypothetical protein NC389_17190 [Acetatifactor muris]|nr:hypothetical protein [Acetatifactor muris]